jgi:hypothetical protein
MRFVVDTRGFAVAGAQSATVTFFRINHWSEEETAALSA